MPINKNQVCGLFPWATHDQYRFMSSACTASARARNVQDPVAGPASPTRAWAWTNRISLSRQRPWDVHQLLERRDLGCDVLVGIVEGVLPPPPWSVSFPSPPYSQASTATLAPTVIVSLPAPPTTSRIVPRFWASGLLVAKMLPFHLALVFTVWPKSST